MNKVIIDTLGSDNGVNEIIEGVLLAKNKYPGIRFVIVGDEKYLSEYIFEHNCSPDDFDYINTTEILTNNQNPKDILKNENKSSLALSLERLKNDSEAIGLITAGSTGALLIGSIFRLGMLEHMRIPFLAARLYSFTKKPFILLDCGANIEMDKNMLLKASKMGSSLANSLEEISSPRIGLVNVGKEENKGKEALREAFVALKEEDLNFVGNIEGDEIFSDKADVLITDGFTGNVILKMAESFGLYMSSFLENIGKKKEGEEIYWNFAYTDLGASILLGPKKLCLKCHGKATRLSVPYSLEILINAHKNGLISSLQKDLNK